MEGGNAGESEATRAQNSQIQIKRSRQDSGIPSHLFTFRFPQLVPLLLLLGWEPGDALGEGSPVGLGWKRKLKNQKQD